MSHHDKTFLDFELFDKQHSTVSENLIAVYVAGCNINTDKLHKSCADQDEFEQKCWYSSAD